MLITFTGDRDVIIIIIIIVIIIIIIIIIVVIIHCVRFIEDLLGRVHNIMIC